MTIAKRLLRKPVTAVFWLLLVAVMTGFLTLSLALYDSSSRLASLLDRSHTAIAVLSDPSVTVTRTYDGATWDIADRPFTAEDKAALEAMPGVKAVRSHTLNVGSSPAFSPIIDVRREWSWGSAGDGMPYCNAVFAGTLRDMHKASEFFYFSHLITGENTMVLLFELDDILLLNGEYDEPRRNMEYVNGFIFLIDLPTPEDAAYFTIGDRYIVSGTFDPTAAGPWSMRLNPDISGRIDPTYFILDAASCVLRDGYWESQSIRDFGWSQATNDWAFESAAGFALPAAERFDGDPQTFFETTPHDIWRTYRDAWQKQSHALPVIGTDRLETVFSFLTGDAAIIEGRSFTDDEYESGARVLILSENMAARCGLTVGDTIALSQYTLQPEDSRAYRWYEGASLHNPTVNPLRLDADYASAEDFTVVGIYRLRADWSSDTYAFTPNTVFIPRAAQLPGAFGEITDPSASADAQSIYGMYLSVELINGRVEDFALALEQSPYIGRFFTYEQGYENVQRDLNGLAESTSGLVWIAGAAWALFLLLYLLMYQSAQKNNLGIMRSLGAQPREAAWYLFGSGAIVALLGVTLGGVLCGVALRIVQNTILSDAIANVDITTAGRSTVLNVQTLTEMVTACSPTAGVLLAAGAAQLMILCLLLYGHAAILSRRLPRTLLEG